MKILINALVKQLNEIQDGKIWIGENFNGKLDSITENEAFTRPLTSLHCVAEILSHLTLWKKEAILKIKTGEGSSTDDCEENWVGVEELKERGWANIKSENQLITAEFIGLLKTKEDSFLEQLYFDTDYKDYFNYLFLIEGILQHDIYHLGQLGIIIKLLLNIKSS